MSEIDSPSFEITFSDGRKQEYIKSKHVRYHWTVGNSGVLMIFKDEMHEVFNIKMKQDERIEAWNAEQWAVVKAIDTVAEDLLDEEEGPVIEVAS